MAAQALAPSVPAFRLSPPAFGDLVCDWLSGMSQRTREAYRQDLLDFMRFLGVMEQSSALEQLTSNGQAHGNLAHLAARLAMTAG
jgi:hypothetical protein